MTLSRYKQSRFWAVCDETGQLVCLCVYKKGAEEVIRRLNTGKKSDNNANVSVSLGNCDVDCGSRRRSGASRANA